MDLHWSLFRPIKHRYPLITVLYKDESRQSEPAVAIPTIQVKQRQNLSRLIPELVFVLVFHAISA